MSRVEPDQFLNDRYAAIEERLQVDFTCFSYCALVAAGLKYEILCTHWQVVRKRLDTPLTLAEKV